MVHPDALWASFFQLLVSLLCAATESHGRALPAIQLTASVYLPCAGEPAARPARVPARSREKCMVWFGGGPEIPTPLEGNWCLTSVRIIEN